MTRSPSSSRRMWTIWCGCRRESVLAHLYAQAWLTVCDSRVLELIADLSGEALDVTTGADLTAALFEDVIRPDEPIVVVGGDESVIDGLKARYGLSDIRWHQPPMHLRHKPDAIAECAAFVADNPARFTFLCVGSPQQELVAEACLERGDCTGVGLCVGASLDFYPASPGGRRNGCRICVWNGCSVSPNSRAACGSAIWWTVRASSFCGGAGAGTVSVSARSSNACLSGSDAPSLA
jgi:hypothetical protein